MHSSSMPLSAFLSCWRRPMAQTTTRPCRRAAYIRSLSTTRCAHACSTGACGCARVRASAVRVCRGSKSQGMSLPYVVCDVGGAFAEGQMYVALSRATSVDGLQIVNFDAQRIKISYAAKRFHAAASEANFVGRIFSNVRRAAGQQPSRDFPYPGSTLLLNVLLVNPLPFSPPVSVCLNIEEQILYNIFVY